MASQLLAAAPPSTSFRSCFSPTHPRLRWTLCAHSGNSFSCSPSSLTLHLQYSVYGDKEARVFCASKATRGLFVGQETGALFLGGKDTRQVRWCQGVDQERASHQQRDRKMYHGSSEIVDAHGCTESSFHGSTESMSIHGCIESRDTSVSQSKKESRVCHDFGLHHECTHGRRLHGYGNHNQTISHQCKDGYRHRFLSSSSKVSCLPHEQSSFKLRISLGRRNFNAYRGFLPNFMKKGFFSTEKDEKQRQRDRQRALLSLCAQAMVASQMGQSTLLSFLWTNWPSMVDELYGGGQGGGNKNNASNGQSREPDNASGFQSPRWRVLLLGFVCGLVIALAINSSMSAGALLDACLWLCFLCSLLFLAAFVVRILCLTVIFISRSGIAALPNSCVQVLQKSVRMSFCQGSFAGISTFLACMFWLNRGSKPRSPTASSTVSSLWSRLRPKIEGKRVGSMKRGGLRQVYSQHLGFLQCILPKQTKL